MPGVQSVRNCSTARIGEVLLMSGGRPPTRQAVSLTWTRRPVAGPASRSGASSRCAVCPEEIEWAMIERLGKYQIVEQIGRGGMGAVYKANDPLLKRVVALKVISENVDASDELRARFFREAQACARLSHPNIITIYDLGEDAGRLFIVMEYLEGEELRQVISQRRDLALESKLALMVQICEGLAYAHQNGIVHRDIKPSNVFISQRWGGQGSRFRRRADRFGEGGSHAHGAAHGDAALHVARAVPGRVDERSDMFSAAAVFYELIAYHPPLALDNPMDMLEELRSAASPSRFRPDTAIPEDLGRVIERALRRNPEERFRNMAEMREALNAVRARLAQEGHLGCAAGSLRRPRRCGSFTRAWWSRSGRGAAGSVAGFRRSDGGRGAGSLLSRGRTQARAPPGAGGACRSAAARSTSRRMDRMRLEEWEAAEGAFEHLVRRCPSTSALREA